MIKQCCVLLSLAAGIGLGKAQFSVEIQVPADFTETQAYVYGYNGSDERILADGVKQGKDTWVFSVKEPYTGALRAYFLQNNDGFSFVSENKDVKVQAEREGGKLRDLSFSDEVNKINDQYKTQTQQKEIILPVLYQMQPFYKQTDSFGQALEKEIDRLTTAKSVSLEGHPFLSFYNGELSKFINNEGNPTAEDYIKFVANAPEYLETSGQARQILYNLMQLTNKGGNMGADIDKLLDTVERESPRGQMVLSEYIDLFDLYSMNTMRDKYLKEAEGLTCTITDRLNKTLEDQRKMAVGAVFPNYKFTDPINTSAKDIHGVKAKKKLVMFWASTCPHCESEFPGMIQNYAKLKNKGVEIIGISVDSDAIGYMRRAKMLPWINDSELRGWNSSAAKLYNVHATPSYYILDEHNKILAKPNKFNDALKML